MFSYLHDVFLFTSRNFLPRIHAADITSFQWWYELYLYLFSIELPDYNIAKEGRGGGDDFD